MLLIIILSNNKMSKISFKQHLGIFIQNKQNIWYNIYCHNQHFMNFKYQLSLFCTNKGICFWFLDLYFCGIATWQDMFFWDVWVFFTYGRQQTGFHPLRDPRRHFHTGSDLIEPVITYKKTRVFIISIRIQDKHYTYCSCKNVCLLYYYYTNT